MKTEPILWIQATQSLLRNGFLLAIGLGLVALTQAQLEMVMTFAASLFFVVEMALGGWMRSMVTPNRTADDRVERAIEGSQQVRRHPPR